MLGNGDRAEIPGGEENVPFCIWNGTIYCDSSISHTIEIAKTYETVHKLNSKYLDLPTNLATIDDVQEAMDIADSKMDASNPVGTGSFSMNRRSGTTVGGYSVALGYKTIASGASSHAEGSNTTASGDSSHAEGTSTTASGNYSHAEGTSTIAQRRSQHVQGENNVLDTEGTTTSRGKYAHIVGNGTSTSARSNAHTLDWNGVGWFQGGLQVGGTAQDDGAKNVMLEGEAYNYFILTDTVTGTPYKIEIKDGNLVSSPFTES